MGYMNDMIQRVAVRFRTVGTASHKRNAGKTLSVISLSGSVFLVGALLSGYDGVRSGYTAARAEGEVNSTIGFSGAGVRDRLPQGGKAHGGPVILQTFPEDPCFYTQDLRGYVREIQLRHGPDEWRVTVLTNEIHDHLGIYSILGAKMGLRARELLQAGVDDIRVLSYAGSRPPLSCLNDGLQVSTGATLGQGAISLSADTEKRAEAEFRAAGRAVRLRLNRESSERIASDLAEGIRQYGNLTPAYFDYVRQLAIRYWLAIDRKTAFEVVGKAPAGSGPEKSRP
jgi:formylmethanofuran dehydrogenase subunit E